jgi:hypothetical protein
MRPCTCFWIGTGAVLQYDIRMMMLHSLHLPYVILIVNSTNVTH